MNETTPLLPAELGRVIDDQSGRLEDELVRIRRFLHSQPEPSGEERETTRYLHAKLEEYGVSARIAGRGVGIVADLDLGNPSDDTPLIAVRADIDALRMPDAKQVEYRSQREGLCHACGHDVHSTAVLGAAAVARRVGELVPSDALDERGHRLRLIFQAAEETSEGARWMVEDGALEGVSAILGLHVDPERPCGGVGIRYGVMTAYCDEVDVEVVGHGGHAARPHHTRDPIAAAAHLVGTLYEFLPRAVDSRNANVFTVGRIEGGYAPNVIPEKVQLQGTLRTTDPSSWTFLKERILEICVAVERATGTRVRCQFSSPLAGVNNDAYVTGVLESAARSVAGAEHVQRIEKPSLGGEDFAVYQEHVPGSMMRIGCAVPGVAQSPYLHSPHFDVDERVITLGSRILLRAALALGTAPQRDYAI